MAAWIDALACQALQGNEVAWKKLFTALTPRLWGLFGHLGSSAPEAEDLIQETWTRVFKNRTEFDPSRHFEPYIFTIAVRLWIDFRRKERRLPACQQLPDDSPSAPAVPIDFLFAVERAESIRRCLEYLGPEEKTILVLRFWHGLTNKGIANQMGLSESSVKNKGYRALRKLADCMGLLRGRSSHDPCASAQRPTT